MSIEVPRALQEVTIDVIDTDPSVMEAVGLNRLLRASTEADFPDRSDAELAYFVGQSAALRPDPNRGVGETFQSGQSFDSPRTIVAYRGEDPIAYLTTANNVSSRLPGPLGQAERYAKLHNDTFIGKRWHWHGTRALRPDYREGAPSEERQRIGELVVDVLGHMANEARRPGQPGSSFPYAEEHLWRATLHGWGLEAIAGSEREVQPFGQDTQPVILERYATPSAEEAMPAKDVVDIREKILAKEGVREALQKVRIRRRSTA